MATSRTPWSVAARLLTGALAAALAAPVAAGLRDDVELLVERTNLPGARVAVSVRDADSGVELVGIDQDAPMVPASNMKLLTTGAALDVLGPDFEFRTELLLDGDRLIVVGGGDPGFGDPVLLDLMHLDVESLLGLWVSAVVDAGSRDVERLVVDDRIFDRSFVHPAWPVDQLNRRYCAEVSGLNFHANVINFYPRPGQGLRPDLELYRPHAPWLVVTNRATTGRDRNDGNDVWIARRLGTNELTFYGNVKHAYTAPAPVTVHDMPTFFARLLADRLSQAGVSVASHGRADDDEPRPGGRTMAPIFSTPVGTAVTRCNRDSQNLYAEALLKRTAYALTGEPGSWTNGTAILRHVLHKRLDDSNLLVHVVASDGSGLSSENRVTAATMTAWLNTFHHDERVGEQFIASLARAGESGTLERRFRDLSLHGTIVDAKSGYIRSVSCLSGYVTASDGHRRSFSILVNGLQRPGDVGRAKRLQEQIVSAVAFDLTAVRSVLGGE